MLVWFQPQVSTVPRPVLIAATTPLGPIRICWTPCGSPSASAGSEFPEFGVPRSAHQGTVHASATKPAHLKLSNASVKCDYPQDEDAHVDASDLDDRIECLHRKIHLAATALPQYADDFYTWTILFQGERKHYTPTIWDDSRQACVGGDVSDASAPFVAENGGCYSEISTVNGLPRTHYVHGYYRADGTYVRSYYRSR